MKDDSYEDDMPKKEMPESKPAKKMSKAPGHTHDAEHDNFLHKSMPC